MVASFEKKLVGPCAAPCLMVLFMVVSVARYECMRALVVA
ncbi:hypothetical protein BRPE64_DCDS02520 (plasmid) [Caballeronia insecticola]|uniref:Uncharacterized protein n=1 Tax=Caballeronia insecticola TaxID=758793 RepID=R4WR94_9BURK|nr:hypothetical protein BRPE64_DCDS02520 [Caballeronia insecticola]